MAKYSLTAPAQPPTSPVVLPTAPAWARASSFVWDAFPAFLLFLIAGALLLPPAPDLSSIVNAGVSSTQSPQAMLLDLYAYLYAVIRVGFIAWLGYVAWHVSFEAIYGTTPGKCLTGMRVASTNQAAACPPQEGLGWRVASIRFTSASASWLTFNVGHALGHWRADRLMLHDMLSHTRVVEDPKVSLPFLGPHDASTHKMWRAAAWVVLLIIFAWKLLAFIDSMTDMVNSLPI